MMPCLRTAVLPAITMPEFLALALLAGIGVAIAVGPLGSFVVWQRMAYFGDTLAHAALLGVAVGLWLNIQPTLAVILVSISLALVLIGLQRQRQIATDTLLGILSHSALAAGLIALALIPGARSNRENLLFGELLTVTAAEVAMIWLTAALVLGVLYRLWRPLLATVVHEDLACVEGVATQRVAAILKLMLAVVIAIAMKVVGVLLITALLIIPAATARRFARTPEQMAVVASAVAALSVGMGLALSWFADTPAGPSIVVSASGLFAVAASTRPSG